jgi:nicotinamidase-related amidase
MTAKASATALLAVDVQHDFLAGGALAVPDADAVLAPLAQLALRHPLVIATRDFHPRDHISFVERGGPWPAHCVAGTEGARIHSDVDRLARTVISKGMDRDTEAYSGFDGTPLERLLRSLGVVNLVIAGLATDYCVRATALAAVTAGFATTVVLDAVRAVDIRPDDGAKALAEMAAAGVTLAPSVELAATAAS